MRMKDIGWVWEGQGIDPGVPPSIYGVGEGAPYFGLTRADFLFHPNEEHALRKMARLDEVVCDISKWKWRWTAEGAPQPWVDASIASVCAEAGNVSRLSLKFPNITGAIHDDMKGLVQREGITPGQYVEIYNALKSANPRLRLWSVVYTHELTPADWDGFQPFMDIVNLWVWNAKDLPKLDDDLERCRQLFPGKPIIMGCYLRDYTTAAPVPMDLLKLQWEKVLRYLNEGKIIGYAILAAVLIDGHRQQADWVRDFIAAN